MGDLAKYIAEVIEFVVAGVLVLFSLLLLGYVLARPDLADLPDELPLLTSMGALLPVVGIALVYALGILAEGMSRVVFEHGLAELTVQRLDGRGSEAMEKNFQSKRAELVDREIADRKLAAAALHTEQVAYYENLREDYRMSVLARSPSLTTQVEGQLKRLRIERATALSGSICTLALVIDFVLRAGDEGLWLRTVLLATCVLITACAIWLSTVRLRRYLGSIIRCYDALPPAEGAAP
jgi:hypothetical protein